MKFKIPFTSIEIHTKKNFTETYTPYNYRLPFSKQDDFVINSTTFYKLYKKNGDVSSCIRELAENIGSSGYSLKRKDGEQEIPEKDIVALEKFFSWDLTARQWIINMVRDMAISGNAYWEIVRAKDGRTVLGINRLDPRTISIVATEAGEVLGYIQRVGSKTQKFMPDQIVHFTWQTDLDNPLFGASPMESIVYEILTDTEAALSNYVFFQNDAQPAAHYILDDTLTNEAIQRAIDLIQDQHKGTLNRHKSTALVGVKEIKQLTVSQKDMEFLEGRKFSTEKVCSAFGVPKFILGYTDSVNNNNGTELLKKFYSGTIAPKEEYIQYAITKYILPALFGHEDYRFVFNPQMFDEAVALENRALAEVAAGILTRRQYKIKTGQEITEQDEEEENFDKHIVAAGASAVMLGDIGLDFNPIQVDETTPA